MKETLIFIAGFLSFPVVAFVVAHVIYRWAGWRVHTKEGHR